MPITRPTRDMGLDHQITPSGSDLDLAGIQVHKAKGFTLVELMISMMIIGIIGMAGFSLVSTWALDQRLSRACQVLVSGIEHTRSLARRYQRPFNLTLSTVDNGFTIVDTIPDPNAEPPQPPPVNADGVVLHPLSNRWYIIDFNTLPGLENTTLLSGPPDLIFDGVGNTTLADVDYVLAAGGQNRTVRVSAINGRVTVL